MTIEIKSDVFVCVKYAMILASTYHILTDDALQSTNKDQQ